jgi:hypothetical protein
MKKSLYRFTISFIIFCIGFTFGKLFDYWWYFEFSKEISIIDALTLFVTIGLALYITKVLEKETQDIRIKKDLYIAKISELEDFLSSFESLMEEPNIFYTKINNRIHSSRIKKNSIFATIRDDFKLINANELEKAISNDMNLLKQFLTGTNTIQLSVKKDIANYSEERKVEIYTKINAIKETFFKMKIMINNL